MKKDFYTSLIGAIFLDSYQDNEPPMSWLWEEVIDNIDSDNTPEGITKALIKEGIILQKSLWKDKEWLEWVKENTN